MLYRSDALHALTPAGEAESPCKDHTGVGAAVLLDAVGVTRDAIIADYTRERDARAASATTTSRPSAPPSPPELIAGVRPAAQSARSDLDVDD